MQQGGAVEKKKKKKQVPRFREAKQQHSSGTDKKYNYTLVLHATAFGSNTKKHNMFLQNFSCRTFLELLG